MVGETDAGVAAVVPGLLSDFSSTPVEAIEGKMFSFDDEAAIGSTLLLVGCNDVELIGVPVAINVVPACRFALLLYSKFMALTSAKYIANYLHT